MCFYAFENYKKYSYYQESTQTTGQFVNRNKELETSL